VAQRAIAAIAVSQISNPWYVYVLLCENDTFYVGTTTDIRKRFGEHLNGQGARWTKNNKPIRIVHHEQLASSNEAFEREKKLKTGFGRKWVKREYEAGRLKPVEL